MSGAAVFDSRICALGEGPLWHPTRNQLFWFDIIGMRLLSRDAEGPQEWQFDESVSAAGWIDHYTLLIASETALSRFDLATGESEYLVGLEIGNQVTRSNDGRADPFGGFWVGTMGKNTEPHAGAIYRYYRGDLERLYGDITIPNSISFSPDGRCAYYADTPTRQIMRQPLDDDGWPAGSPTIFVDLNAQGLNPDGAVVDTEGCLWIAEWGASRVARHNEDGVFLSAVDLPASQISCPAFGGAGLTTLFATSAAIGLDETHGGSTFSREVAVKGQAEHRVVVE